MEDNDRGELADLVTRLGTWLDENRFDETRSILTEDVVAETVGATIKANLLVVFVQPDGLEVHGEIYVLDAVRAADGWRISRVQGRPLWNTALPPEARASETALSATRTSEAAHV